MAVSLSLKGLFEGLGGRKFTLVLLGIVVSILVQVGWLNFDVLNSFLKLAPWFIGVEGVADIVSRFRK